MNCYKYRQTRLFFVMNDNFFHLNQEAQWKVRSTDSNELRYELTWQCVCQVSLSMSCLVLGFHPSITLSPSPPVVQTHEVAVYISTRRTKHKRFSNLPAGAAERTSNVNVIASTDTILARTATRSKFPKRSVNTFGLLKSSKQRKSDFYIENDQKEKVRISQTLPNKCGRRESSPMRNQTTAIEKTPLRSKLWSMARFCETLRGMLAPAQRMRKWNFAKDTHLLF